jgi:hypothetical protein
MKDLFQQFDAALECLEDLIDAFPDEDQERWDSIVRRMEELLKEEGA